MGVDQILSNLCSLMIKWYISEIWIKSDNFTQR